MIGLYLGQDIIASIKEMSYGGKRNERDLNMPERTVMYQRETDEAKNRCMSENVLAKISTNYRHKKQLKIGTENLTKIQVHRLELGFLDFFW